MFLYNNDKKNIAKIISFLMEIKDSYRSQLNMIEIDISRITKTIEESKNNLQDIKASMDTSYMILSSSQVAKANEFAEIDSLQEIINLREMELTDLKIRQEELLEKLSEVEEVIACANAVREVLEDKSFT